MSKDIETVEYMLTQLREFPQYESIEYAGDFVCPTCGESGDKFMGGTYSRRETIKEAPLIGWCNTPNGYMMVFECPICFEKFRYHNSTTERNNWESFKNELWLVWILQRDNAR